MNGICYIYGAAIILRMSDFMLVFMHITCCITTRPNLILKVGGVSSPQKKSCTIAEEIAISYRLVKLSSLPF